MGVLVAIDVTFTYTTPRNFALVLRSNSQGNIIYV